MGFKGVATPLMTFCLFFVTEKEGYQTYHSCSYVHTKPVKNASSSPSVFDKIGSNASRLGLLND